MEIDPDGTKVAALPLAQGGTLFISELREALPETVAAPLAAALAQMDPWHRYGIPASRLATFLGPPQTGAPRYLLLAGNNGRQIAGLVALKLGWMFGTYLNLLAVLPAYQRNGIGRAVLDWLEATARQRTERNQFVVTSAFNVAGLALYEKHGFKRIAELPGLISDEETEILLRKTLY